MTKINTRQTSDGYLDEWFAELAENYFNGRAEQIRYCDDMVFVFENRGEAEQFFKVLPKRLAKYGLNMHHDKSQMVPSGHKAIKLLHRQGQKLPVYSFLGFTCYWGLSRNGWLWRIKCKSRSDRLSAKLKGIRKFLRNNLAEKTDTIILRVSAIIRGWMNYHSISDNAPRVWGFIDASKKLLFWWINRKGGKRQTNWHSSIAFSVAWISQNIGQPSVCLQHQEGIARACHRERSAGNLHAAF